MALATIFKTVSVHYKFNFVLKQGSLYTKHFIFMTESDSKTSSQHPTATFVRIENVPELSCLVIKKHAVEDDKQREKYISKYSSKKRDSTGEDTDLSDWVFHVEGQRCLSAALLDPLPVGVMTSGSERCRNPAVTAGGER